MSHNSEILPQLLEEWVKELKVEIVSINRCGNVLRSEINNLKQEVAILSNLNQDIAELKGTCTKGHDDHELRMRAIESSCHDVVINKDVAHNNTKNLERILEDKIKTISTETKKNSDNWIWTVRYLVVATLGILSKLIIF